MAYDAVIRIASPYEVSKIAGILSLYTPKGAALGRRRWLGGAL